MLAALRAPALRQSATLQDAYAAVVTGQVNMVTALNTQVAQLGQVVGKTFWSAPGR